MVVRLLHASQSSLELLQQEVDARMLRCLLRGGARSLLG
jgi:hypothetical protein